MRESESEQRYFELPKNHAEDIIKRFPELREAIPDLTGEKAESRVLTDIFRGEEVFHWRLKDFFGQAAIQKLKGPAIEIAGPTEDSYDFLSIDTSKIPQKVYVSNLFSGAPMYEDGGMAGIRGKVDFQADALQMPCRENSVGIVLCSNFSPSGENMAVAKLIKERERLFALVLIEARRILKQKGLFIGQGITLKNLIKAKECGLDVCEYQIRVSTGSFGSKKLTYGSVILQKP